MTSKRLTRKQALILQRYADDEVSDAEREEAQALLEESAAARVYVSALEELTEAVRWAEEKVWEDADLGSAATWAKLAQRSSEFSEASLDDLAPLLERFYDGEADAAEAAVVASLVDERDDVAQYLAELEGLGECVRSAAVDDEVDFDGFFDAIADDLDAIDDERQTAPVAVEPFDLRRDLRLLHRYHDGEVTAEQRRRVQAWIDADDPQVDAALGALAEIHLGVEAAVEVACEKADFEAMDADIGDGLDAADAERAADNVVSLADSAESSTSAAPTPFWTKPIVAAAAAVALLVSGALIGPQLVEQDDEPVERNTVVIFDDIQHAPGSSVFLHAPQLADHEMAPGAEFDFQYVESDTSVEGGGEEPTVLWLIDDEEEPDDDDTDPEDETEELPGPI